MIINKPITGTDKRGKVGDTVISDSLDEVIRKDRIKNREFPVGHDVIDLGLRELKKNEPTSDNDFFRLCITAYEFGDLCRSVVYSQRFRNSKKALFRDGFKDKNVILSEGKLAMADLITQLNMFCISMEWDFNELRKMGMEHLRERQKDFNRDGWSEVK